MWHVPEGVDEPAQAPWQIGNNINRCKIGYSEKRLATSQKACGALAFWVPGPWLFAWVKASGQKRFGVLRPPPLPICRHR